MLVGLRAAPVGIVENLGVVVVRVGSRGIAARGIVVVVKTAGEAGGDAEGLARMDAEGLAGVDVAVVAVAA
jgi:hypothetical protein